MNIASTMENKLTLKILEEALYDWSQPVDRCFSNLTDEGLCKYFSVKYHLGCIKMSHRWMKYATNPDGAYHFYLRGNCERGRDERVCAIKMMIEDFKEESLKRSWWLKIKMFINLK